MAGVPTFIVVTPPAPIVALADARSYPGVPASASDGLLQAQIDAAIGFLDGPDGWLNRSLGLQTIQCTITPGLGFRRPEPIVLAAGPVLSIVSATGLSGTDSFGSPAVILDGDALVICQPCGPTFGGVPQPVVVQYTAGSSPGVIAVARQAILSMAARGVAAAAASARDPSLRSESVPDVFSKSYGSAGASGASGGMSAGGSSDPVLGSIAHLRRLM